MSFRRILGQQLSLRSDQRQYNLYSTHPSDPSCDWLCLVNNAEQALHYLKLWEVPHVSAVFDGECFYPLTNEDQ